MNQHITSNFDKDEEGYDQAVRFWDNLWWRLFKTDTERKDWKTHWMTRHYSNGKRIMDGNPIFTAINYTTKRAVRIIQHDSDADMPSVYLDRVFLGKEKELVISINPSDYNIMWLRPMLYAWIYGPYNIFRDMERLEK